MGLVQIDPNQTRDPHPMAAIQELLEREARIGTCNSPGGSKVVLAGLRTSVPEIERKFRLELVRHKEST